MKSMTDQRQSRYDLNGHLRSNDAYFEEVDDPVADVLDRLRPLLPLTDGLLMAMVRLSIAWSFVAALLFLLILMISMISGGG